MYVCMYVSCALITRTSGRHVFIYLLLYFSDPFLLLNRRINHSIREEKKKTAKKTAKKKKNPVTQFLVTPFTRYAVTRFTGNRLHAQYAAQYANFERRSDRRWRLIRSHLLAISASKKAE